MDYPRVSALWIYCLTFIGLCSGRFNLFVNQTETRRLLGIAAEVYYVRDGVVNNYALSFNIPVSKDVNDIYFDWQNVGKSPKTGGMFYTLDITADKSEAMYPPEATIPSRGSVPDIPSVFSIRLMCTGKMDAEIEIHIKLNVNDPPYNQTELDIRRKKSCRLVNDSYDVYEVRTEDSNAWSLSAIFYIPVGCACALIFLIAFVVGVCYVRSQKNAQALRMGDGESTQGLAAPNNYLRTDTPVSSLPGIPGARRPFSALPEFTSTEVAMALEDLHIERKRISLGDVIMEGTFGQIYQGVLLSKDENEIGNEQDIYVKTVTDQARLDHIEVLLREGIRLKDCSHDNVNAMIGCCLDNKLKPLLVFPYLSIGNLKKFLQCCKVSETGSHAVLSTQQLVYMALQIIRGVQFLHKRRLVHKDLATRNCIVDRDLRLKVTDTALARDLFPADYHCLGDNENRPVKWLSVEALLERQFSPASDVWSFGVTLWELMTLGQQPYADIDPFEMATYLKEGYRISQPINCPDELFAVMACCWAMAPDERPKFSQLLVCLQDFYTALGRFI